MEPSDIDSEALKKAIARLPAGVRVTVMMLQGLLADLRKSVDELTHVVREKDAELAELRATLNRCRSTASHGVSPGRGSRSREAL